MPEHPSGTPPDGGDKDLTLGLLRLALEPDRVTPVKLWRALAPEQRKAVVEAVLAEPDAEALADFMRLRLSEAQGFREKTVRGWPRGVLKCYPAVQVVLYLLTLRRFHPGLGPVLDPWFRNLAHPEDGDEATAQADKDGAGLVPASPDRPDEEAEARGPDPGPKTTAGFRLIRITSTGVRHGTCGSRSNLLSCRMGSCLGEPSLQARETR